MPCLRQLLPTTISLPFSTPSGMPADLAAVAAALLERLQYRYPGDAAELDVVLADEAEVEVLGAVAGWGVDQDHRRAGLLGADQRRHDSLLGAGDDGQHVELAGDGVVDLLRLQCRIEMLTDRVHFHPERVRLGNESLGQRRDERVRRRRDEKGDLFAFCI